MVTEEQSEEYRERWMITDIFKFMWTTVKNNLAGMICIFIFYGGAAAAVNLLMGKQADSMEAFFYAIFTFVIVLSLVSVLRPAFAEGRLRFRDIFPSLGFIGKIILFFILIILLGLAVSFILGAFTVFGGMIFGIFFGRLFTPDTIHFLIGLGIFINLLFSIYFSFCMIAFAGKNGFGESLGYSLKIFTENKLLVFCVFFILAAALAFALSSYITPIIAMKGSVDPAALKKLMDLQHSLLPKISLICSFLMPIYWMLLMSVYFKMGHEGDTKKVIEYGAYTGNVNYYSSYSPAQSEDTQSSEDIEGFESFSLTNALYFSWGIYKHLFKQLTSGIILVYAAFILVSAVVISALHAADIVTLFSGKMPSIRDTFVILSAALVLYYFLMFFYTSFARGFFRGKGINFSNFFPPYKVILRFVAFLSFIAAFLLSVPFIIEKVNVLLQIAIKNFAFPFTAVIGGCSVLFAVIIVYALVSLFYVPFFILDGHIFSDALTVCSEMMKGQRMAFFCVLFALFFVNIIGHMLIVGWLVTVPLSVLILIQVYITISVGYSKYHEDIVQY